MLDDFTKNELLKKKSIMYLICVKDLSFEGVNSLYLFLENQLFYNACAFFEIKNKLKLNWFGGGGG